MTMVPPLPWTDGDVLSSRPDPDILLLTLNRPKSRNALSENMLIRLIAALDQASRDPTLRAVVVTGNPAGRAFCAGADLNPQTSGFAGSSQSRPAPTRAEFRDGGGYSSLAALRCTKPIICAINGAAVGWGLAFPLAADIRVAAAGAKVGFTMAARGLVNESCSSWLLPRLVGAGKAKELVYTGRVFYASEAHVEAPGLFNHVVALENVVPTAMRIAREIAANASGMSVAMCKFLMDNAWECSVEDAMLNESACLHHVNHVRTLDVREGIASFLEKRNPKWTHDAWHDLPWDSMPFTVRRDVRPRSKALAFPGARL